MKTVLVESIPVVDGNDIKLRVEIFSWSDREYSCQIFRLDWYRIKPTFYEDIVADEVFLVHDCGIDWHHLRAPSADELLTLIFEKMEYQFGIKIERPGSVP